MCAFHVLAFQHSLGNILQHPPQGYTPSPMLASYKRRKGALMYSSSISSVHMLFAAGIRSIAGGTCSMIGHCVVWQVISLPSTP